MNKELKKYEDTIKELMGCKRFKHSVNVADMCVKLAKKFGVDEDKAYTAGILHDCQKEVDRETMLKEVKDSGFYVDPVELDCFKLWHGIAAAYYIRETLKIEDKDILNAVRFHTVGRANMSQLEKIVYLADMVSEERDYPDVEKYRAAVMKDLNNGMFLSLRYSILKTVGLGNTIPICTVEAYDFYSKYKNPDDFVFKK